MTRDVWCTSNVFIYIHPYKDDSKSKIFVFNMSLFEVAKTSFKIIQFKPPALIPHYNMLGYMTCMIPKNHKWITSLPQV